MRFAPVLDRDVRELIDEFKDIFLIPTKLPPGTRDDVLERTTSSDQSRGNKSEASGLG